MLTLVLDEPVTLYDQVSAVSFLLLCKVIITIQVCELLQLHSLDITLKLKTLQMHVQNLFRLSHLLKNAAEGKTDAS